jgi:hypothetical protein
LTCERPADHRAVHRHALTGPHAQALTRQQFGQGHGLPGAARLLHLGAGRHQGLQAAHRAAGGMAGTALQPAPQQHEGDDGGARLEEQLHARAALQRQPARQTEGRRGAQHHQQVHARRLRTQAAPGGAPQPPRGQQQHEGRQRRLGGGRQMKVQPEGHQQHGQQQRQRGAPGQQQVAAQRGGLLGQGVALVGQGLQGRHVTGLARGGQQGRGRRAGQGLQPHAGLREVDGQLHHTRHAAQRTLQRRKLHRLVQALDPQRGLAERGLVAGLLERLHDVLGLPARQQLELGALVGQQHLGLAQARYALQGLLHAPDAGRAMHAADVQGD